MKNKEIEELLDYYQKEIDKYEETKQYLMKKYGYDEETIDNISQHQKYKNNKLLLSYIEQLKKRNKELYEGFIATQEELTDYATKNENLENNRDKAIERCEFWLDFYRNVNNDERIILRLNDILNKLKGDDNASTN